MTSIPTRKIEMKTAIELAARLSARYLDTKQMLPDELAHESAAMILQQAEQIEALEQAIAQEQAVLEPESCSTCGNNEAPFAKCDVCTVQYDSDEVSNWEPNP